MNFSEFGRHMYREAVMSLIHPEEKDNAGVVDGWELRARSTERVGSVDMPHPKMWTTVSDLDGFEFSVYRTTPVAEMGKTFGMQDLQIGDPAFDRDYIIQSNDSEKLKSLLGSQGLLDAIRSAGPVCLEKRHGRTVTAGGSAHRVVDVSLDHRGQLSDDRFDDFAQLFFRTLDQLVAMGSIAKPSADAAKDPTR